MKWEKLAEILLSPNAVFILAFLLLTIIIFAILGKKGILSFDIKGIKLNSREIERTIIRQQSE